MEIWGRKQMKNLGEECEITNELWGSRYRSRKIETGSWKFWARGPKGFTFEAFWVWGPERPIPDRLGGNWLVWYLENNIIQHHPGTDTNSEKPGGLLIGRTVAVLVTFTLGTSMAARQGAIPMAAHQICLQVWLAVSLLTDSLALSGQALIADAVAKRDYKKAKKVAYRVLQIGLGCGLALAVILFAGFVPFSKLFINDTTVLEIMASGVLFVAGTQPINALAFVFDGLHYGVSDFAYAAYSMIVVGTISSTWLVLAPPILGLAGVWAGLALFMGLRMAAGFWRLGRTEGPWQFLTQDREDKELEVD